MNQSRQDGRTEDDLSGAATDVARVISAMIDMKDTPMMTRKTLTAMLTDGAALTSAGLPRAGHGFDALAVQGGGNFHGPKGGSLPTSNNVLELNGQ